LSKTREVEIVDFVGGAKTKAWRCARQDCGSTLRCDLNFTISKLKDPFNIQPEIEQILYIVCDLPNSARDSQQCSSQKQTARKSTRQAAGFRFSAPVD
jgi:hypothetical protein